MIVIMKKLLLLPVIAALLFMNISAQAQQVTIPGSELKKINSTIVGQEYVLHIQLPGGYATSNKKYPVLYLMDSQWDFPLLGALYGEQYYDGFIPECIIVGITWGGINPRPDSLRARDYTPTHLSVLPQSGGAPAFLSFMKKELFPFIESNYRADPDNRSLIGCSFGGLFTLFALFAEPGMFQGYIAASPAFEWDNRVLLNYEKTYFEKKHTAPARLYMTMGGVERGVPGFEQFVKHLTDRNYKNIQIKTRVLDNTGHSGTKGESYARGLQYVFERPSLALDAATLNRYTGNYGFPNYNVEIKNENNQLVGYAGPNRDKYILYAANATDFYSISEYLYVRFKVNNGKVEGFQLDRFGDSRFIPKK
jgi:predicted alpha/beta superfamily hydrolase